LSVAAARIVRMFEFVEVDELSDQLLASAPLDTPDGLAQITPDLDPSGQWVDRLVLLERVTSAAEAERMQIMSAMCDWAETWQDTHDPHRRSQLGPGDLVAAELAPALHLSPVTAAIKVERACRIVHDLPDTHRALRNGDLDLGRVLAIDDATKTLDHPDHAGRVERAVLGKAVDQTAGELRRSLARAVITVDPAAAEKRRKQAVKDRSVARYQEKDGTSVLRAVLSAIDTGEIYDLIEEVARRTKTDGDTRTADARRADALVLIVTGRAPNLGPGDDPPPPGPADGPGDGPGDGSDEEPVDLDPIGHPMPDEPTDLDERFTAGADDTDHRNRGRAFPPGCSRPDEPDDLDDRFPPSRELTDLVARAMATLGTRRPARLPWVAINKTTNPDGETVLVGELQDYGPITAESAEHLLDTGTARPPPQQTSREPTAAQANRHDPPAWLAEEIKARDGTCRFPGCARSADRVDLDHTISFPTGLTVRVNLGGLCRRHHRIKQSGCWAVRQHSDGTFEWISKISGCTYTTHPRGQTGDWRGTTTHPRGQTGE